MSAEVAEGVGHAGVPGGCAGHEGCVIGDDYALEIVVFEDLEDLWDVDIAVIDEGFAVVGYFTADVAAVDIGEFLLSAVGFDCFVDISLGHFGQGAQAEFEGIGWAGLDID